MIPSGPPSPTGSASTARSGINSQANSPRPVPTSGRKTYRRGSGVNKPAGLTRSGSSSSISRSNSGNVAAGTIRPPPSLDMPFANDDASVGHSPLPTPTTNRTSFFFDEAANGQPAPDQSQSPETLDAAIITPDPQNPNHRRSLPRPLPPSKCPLLCVFFAEFDIVVGPKVCFQSPHKFMHFDVDTGLEEMHHALEETFQSVIPNGDEKQQAETVDNESGNGEKQTGRREDSASVSQQDSEDYWNWSPTPKTTIIEREVSGDEITLPSSGHKDDRWLAMVSATEGGTDLKSSFTKRPTHERKRSSASTSVAEESTNNATNTTAHMTSSHSRNPSLASSKGTISNPPTHDGDTSTIDTELMQNSIFAATSEYIITGNELANQTITVSTHGMHILSRPMIIQDTQRYERNSLLFAVGFVLRRNVDPRPYWPVLSNLSSTFRNMEVESEFLTNPRTRPQIQTVLEDVLVSLNSKRRDCHLLLDDANLLNLHLFRPPPPPTPPVPDHAVPILLRPEWQLQMFDWDLTINWIVPHIDGCKYVKQIATTSEVDLEMVRACLRVLRHHGVLATSDVFRYSNVYESTPLARRLQSPPGKKAEAEMNKLLDAAFCYCAKAKHIRQAQAVNQDLGVRNDRKSPNSLSHSPSSNIARRLQPHMNSLQSLDLSVNSATTPLAHAIAAGSSRRRRGSSNDGNMSSPRSFPSRTGQLTIREEHSMDDSESPGPNKGSMMSKQQSATLLREIDAMKKALARLYSSCTTSQSFGEMLLAKMENKGRHSSDGNLREKTAAKSFVETTLAPLREASESEPATSSDLKDGDKAVFDYFDHRRLVTFGVVRGLIQRVHQYPLALARHDKTDKEETNLSGAGRDSVSSHDVMSAPDEFSHMDISPGQYQVPIEMTAMREATLAADAAAKAALDERSVQSASYSTSPLLQGFLLPQLPGTSPLLQGFPPPLSSRDEQLRAKANREEMQHRSKKALLDRIAAVMDGTRCDDELSCMFETPIETLIEMLKESGKWSVISVFSGDA
ncbi:hypothetical protein ACHAXT_000781 [Thalassiosira profunda]